MRVGCGHHHKTPLVIEPAQRQKRSLGVDRDAVTLDVESRSTCESLRASLDGLQDLGVRDAFIRDEVLEEYVQVLAEVVDVPIGADERVGLPAGVRSGPEVPSIAGKGDARRSLGPDRLDASFTGEPDHDLIVGCARATSPSSGSCPDIIRNISPETRRRGLIFPGPTGRGGRNFGQRHALSSGLVDIGEGLDVILIVGPSISSRPRDRVPAGANQGGVLGADTVA